MQEQTGGSSYPSSVVQTPTHYYVQVVDGKVINKIWFEGPMPEGWPDAGSWIESAEAQVGWTYDGTSFKPPPQPPSYSDAPIMGGTIRDVIT